jgi:hypothetical protein
MVDLAVGTPEVGAVNANVLHTLLHAMLRQLNIVDVLILFSFSCSFAPFTLSELRN